MAQKDSLRDTLHERLDKLSEQLDQAWDEAEQAYRDLAEQQEARRKEFRAVALQYQRNWQELSEKAIRYCAKRAGSLPPSSLPLRTRRTTASIRDSGTAKPSDVMI
jgi:hypothetical protein